MSRTFAFVFVCQQGELEIKSALLAASLKKYLRCEYELIAAVPGGSAPAASSKAFLESLGVRFLATGNEIDPTYLIANKVDCLRVSTTADKLVFLDSDMILMREFADEARFDIPFNARPASYPTYSKNDADWEPIYRACLAPMPTARVRTTYSGEYILPYFNAAFIAVPGNSGFGNAWLECCKIIDALDVPNKRPYLDQIALGVAAAKLGLEMDALDERYNHPINFKPMNELDLPYFCHYHDWPTLKREPAAVAEVRALMEEFPELRELLPPSPCTQGEGRGEGLPANDPHPNPLPGYKEREQKPPRTTVTPELIIAGIPRSGTSYLCNLLHRFDNCVVINEPVEAPAALMQETLPYGVARFFRDIRRDVIAGIPIRNKLSQDTAITNDVQTYLPKVSAEDFVLGIKATIAFLSRLSMLRSVMPNARFVACVRDPLDCIASWKTSFPHLHDANVDGVNVGNSDDPWITGMQRKQLKSIAKIPDAASRRAAWWDYLASLILESREQLILVRYDDLVLRPTEVLENILKDWPAGAPTEPIEPSTIRRRRESLDADDVAAIGALCRRSAELLGVWR